MVFSLFSKQRFLALMILALAHIAPLAADSGTEPAVAAPNSADKKVRDLHYGTVLFDFYQQNYFSSAVNLLIAQQKNHLPNHQLDGQLLLGGLYLSYGLHSEAEVIFEKILATAAAPTVRDRAWFFLGKIRYQKQLFVEAEQALSRVGNALDVALQEEFVTLKANLLMAQKKYDEAALVLQNLVKTSADSDVNYARFNLGVAFIRLGQERLGMDFLSQVANSQVQSSDQKALKDKANLVLGFSILKKSPDLAKVFLRKVRLQGPYSNKALLGLGWAEVELQQYEQALVPWDELANREKTDLAVFEALLASGNALERLRAFPQAMQSYKNAITIFERELASLNDTVDAVKTGRLWVDLLAQVDRNETGWFWEAELLPNTPEARYLPVIMAEHAFHETIKNMRDLWFLDKKLARWSAELPAFDTMLALRRDTYESQLTKLTPEQTLGLVADARISREAYAQELARIADSEDVYQLASEAEKKLLERLHISEERIWRISSQQGRHTRRLPVYRDRYRLYAGLLSYDIETSYAIRLRKVKKSLNSLDAELQKILLQQNSLQRVRALTPTNFNEYQYRIDDKRQRVEHLRSEIKIVFDEQRQALQYRLETEFDTLRARLIDYLDQARFSLAHLQDLVSDASESGEVLK
jgi:tetratricopeptide (TPR) repeat protein